MLLQQDNCAFSLHVWVHGKACLAGNGVTLVKRHNAVRGPRHANPKGALVVSRNRVAMLDKGNAIACALRLVAKHHKSAEPVIILLKEH